MVGLKQWLTGTRTGQSNKRVNGSRRKMCTRRQQGDFRATPLRGWMLESIYRVPGRWLNAYEAYTQNMAEADLRSCAARGTLPHSAKVVRYDKLGLKNPQNAVAYALKKYQGFTKRDIEQYQRYGKNLPYTQFSALKNIRRARRGKSLAYEVAPMMGLVVDKKTGTRYKVGNTGPRTNHRYTYTNSYTKAEKNRQRRSVSPVSMRVTPSGNVYRKYRNGSEQLNQQATLNRLKQLQPRSSWRSDLEKQTQKRMEEAKRQLQARGTPVASAPRRNSGLQLASSASSRGSYRANR